ncbi:MAG: tRNA (adenosine(37)-N6)-dimethylallyltransferase MiaA [Prevotellaceae bacterium]|jgi:tRNA dimethylallyltransferase|nr:tRNA (adenosine(37)-N6)-dimethylallyltransferase MiaA [Prevotellaceae bacterium]
MTCCHSLLVLLGPTGVGKTEVAVRLAQTLDCQIVSADSRQLFREIQIGTAPPTAEQLAAAQHHFIGTHSIFDRYSAGQFEIDTIKLLTEIFEKQKVAMLVGGSMLYIDAVCKGIDNIPTVDDVTRTYWNNVYREKGLEFIQNKLRELDPKHFNEQVDIKNAKRMIHALEICTITGRPFSEIRTGKTAKRNFKIVKTGLNLPRKILYNNINMRVDKMIENGLTAEAEKLYPYRELNSLNTVGYKELFDCFDGKTSLEFAIEQIKRNTRHYAKRQLSWFRRDKEITWFEPHQQNEILEFLKKQLHT